MKWLAAKAVAAYTAALLMGVFLNIDRIVPWYAGLVQTESKSAILQVLVAVQRVNHDWGIAQALDSAEFRLNFLYSPSYKDDSRFLGKTTGLSPLPPDSRLPSAAESRRLRQTWREANGPLRTDLTIRTATFVAAKDTHERSPSRQPDLRMAAEEQPAVGWSISPPRDTKDAAQPATAPEPSPEKTSASKQATEPGLTMGLDAAPVADTPSAPTAPLLTTPQTPSQATTLLVLGDSLALGLAPSLERALEKYEGLTFARVGKVSSGLTIPHLFNWDKNIAGLIDEHKASILVVMMGVNDANNNVRVGDKKAFVGTPSWPQAYQERVENFLKIIADRQVAVYWVGLPVVRDEAMSQRIEIANCSAREACAKFSNCRFIDTRGVLTDESGQYTNFKKDNRGYNIRIRAKDGVHFSTEGGDLLSEYILQYISQYVELRPKKELDKHI